MALVIPNNQKTLYLDALKLGYFPSPRIHLFQNNVVPDGTFTLASFTEATFTGYSSQLVTWGASFLNGSNKGQLDSGLHTFTAGTIGTSNTVYGYYVTDSGSTTCLFSERNPAGGVLINTTGQVFTVRLHFTDDTAP